MPTHSERVAEILRRAAAGESYAAIGRAVGLSRQRVAQIVKAQAVDPSPRRRKKVRAVRRLSTSLYLSAEDVEILRELAGWLGLSRSAAVSQAVRELHAAKRRRFAP